ncbi:MAG: exo-alpha-sialidase [Opitutae bacterium]|nr:exo-alpha-sialidase [Opitutae bacterium]
MKTHILFPTVWLGAVLFAGTAGAAVPDRPPEDTGVPMTRPEESMAVNLTDYYHGSTFVQLADGRILQASNSRFCTSDDGGLTWSAPHSCKDVNGDPVGGPGTGLVKLAGQGIGLVAIKRAPDKGPGTDGAARQGSYCAFWRSEDEGRTWQAPIAVTPPGPGTACLQDVLLRTASGRIILPVDNYIGQRIGPDNRKPPSDGKLVRNQWVSTSAHFFDPHFSSVAVYYSDDEGRTWQRNRDGDLFILLDWNSGYNFVSEPSVAEVRPGRLLMILRNGLGRLFQAWSDDNGETWTRPEPTSLAATTTPAKIRQLPTGDLLIVWNQESEDEVRAGYNRTRLSSAISRNGGSIWEFFQNIESLLPGTRVEPGPIRPVRAEEIYSDPGHPAAERDPRYVKTVEAHGRWAYPSVFVMKDRVIVAYTYGTFEDEPDKARQYVTSTRPGKKINQKQKVLPLKWFYGGKEPAKNPQFKDALAPAKP